MRMSLRSDKVLPGKAKAIQSSDKIFKHPQKKNATVNACPDLQSGSAYHQL